MRDLITKEGATALAKYFKEVHPNDDFWVVYRCREKVSGAKVYGVESTLGGSNDRRRNSNSLFDTRSSKYCA